jgi:hypothetical protein
MPRAQAIDKIRLQALDPHAFALDVATAVAVHLGALVPKVAPGQVVVASPTATPLYGHALALARYALDGTELADPEGAILWVHQALHASSALPEPDPSSSLLPSDPQHLPRSVGGWARLVTLAARARARLAAAHPVPAGELAALTGTSADYLRQQVREGALVAVGQKRSGAFAIDALSARAWYQSRTSFGKQSNDK